MGEKSGCLASKIALTRTIVPQQPLPSGGNGSGGGRALGLELTHSNALSITTSPRMAPAHRGVGQEHPRACLGPPSATPHHWAPAVPARPVSRLTTPSGHLSQPLPRKRGLGDGLVRLVLGLWSPAPSRLPGTQIVSHKIHIPCCGNRVHIWPPRRGGDAHLALEIRVQSKAFAAAQSCHRARGGAAGVGKGGSAEHVSEDV